MVPRVLLLGALLLLCPIAATPNQVHSRHHHDLQALRAAAINGSDAEITAGLLSRIPPSARIVLLGEATHGSRELYQRRADLTRALITERGFGAVVVEADFTDAYRTNLFVRGLNQDATAEAALEDYTRFPSWFYSNRAVADFVAWLRRHNDAAAARSGPNATVGWYGLDLQVSSLRPAAAAVYEAVLKLDALQAEAVADMYNCFNAVAGWAPWGYSERAAGATAPGPCEEGVKAAQRVVGQLVAAARAAGAAADPAVHEELFMAEAMAAMLRHAESYFRNMGNNALTFNLREAFFMEVLQMTEQHLATRAQPGPPHAEVSTDGAAAAAVAALRGPGVVLWAHNTHTGDGRVTHMTEQGQVSVAQLVREAYAPSEVYLVGFSTHTGTVTAGDTWGGPMRMKEVRPSDPHSYEHLFHSTCLPEFALDLRDPKVAAALQGRRLHRYIGATYAPDHEHRDHYNAIDLASAYDAVWHVDVTSAVEPLPAPESWLRDREDLAGGGGGGGAAGGSAGGAGGGAAAGAGGGAAGGAGGGAAGGAAGGAGGSEGAAAAAAAGGDGSR